MISEAREKKGVHETRCPNDNPNCGISHGIKVLIKPKPNDDHQQENNPHDRVGKKKLLGPSFARVGRPNLIRRVY